MQLRAGDTFFAPWPGDGPHHLFFVISDPAQNREQVVIVPLMTWTEYKESTCILERGEHRFIRHRSYIDYQCARDVSAAYIEERIADRRFRTHDTADSKLLTKIREGAGRSERLELGHRDILKEQGLVDPL